MPFLSTANNEFDISIFDGLNCNVGNLLRPADNKFSMDALIKASGDVWGPVALELKNYRENTATSANATMVVKRAAATVSERAASYKDQGVKVTLLVTNCILETDSGYCYYTKENKCTFYACRETTMKLAREQGVVMTWVARQESKFIINFLHEDLLMTCANDDEMEIKHVILVIPRSDLGFLPR